MAAAWRNCHRRQACLAPRTPACHQHRVTTGSGDNVAAASADSFARDWQALRADAQIQFAPLELPENPPPPGWLDDLLRFLGRILGPAAEPTLWILAAIAVGLIALVLWQVLAPMVEERRKAGEGQADAAPEWAPDTHEALALLEEADRLAAEGRYDEATHLLLQRSVGQIAAARPDLLDPSSTAREIAVMPALPEAARRAFAVIAERVERSLFALRNLSAEDWHAARAAYADFALAARREALAPA
jgi:hypothetical protein